MCPTFVHACDLFNRVQVAKAAFPVEYEAWVKSEDKDVKKERKNIKTKKLDEGALLALEKRNKAAAAWFKMLLECCRDRPAWEALVALCREAATEAPTSPQRVAAQVCTYVNGRMCVRPWHDGMAEGAYAVNAMVRWLWGCVCPPPYNKGHGFPLVLIDAHITPLMLTCMHACTCVKYPAMHARSAMSAQP